MAEITHPHDTTSTPGDQTSASRNLALAALVGAAVTLSLATYAQVHAPTGAGITTLGFPAVLPMKVALTTGAATLAVVQLVTAGAMWQRLPGQVRTPTWVPALHRWSGTSAFLLTLPVAYHCLWSLGFQSTTPRVLAHSVLGCLFYGALATKLLLLRADGLPARVLPLAGGVLLALLVGAWSTSALWVFAT